MDEKGTLTHRGWVSSHPNWIGQSQPRVVELQGDTLVLSTADPIRSQGKDIYAYFTWRRAKTQTQS